MTRGPSFDDPASTPADSAMTRLTGIWGDRREIRNWWWVLPVAALVHAQMAAGTKHPKFLGKIPIHLKLRGGLQVACRANEIFQIIEVFILGDYENPNVPYQDVATVLDVGANIGVSTIWFSRKCPRARIFAVEPSSETSARLLRNVNRNGLGDRVTVLTLALGESSRSVHLVFAEHSGLSHTAAEPHEGSETVWSADLRTILGMVGGHLDLMKLDCEGAEYGIVLGADDETLSRIDNIVGEYHGSDLSVQARFFARLTEAGFAVSHHWSSDPSVEVGIFSAIRRDPNN